MKVSEVVHQSLKQLPQTVGITNLLGLKPQAVLMNPLITTDPSSISSALRGK
jgi:hypothetical protein